ncbi:MULTISPECIES: hypothetical protein [unclassified Nocardioides]|uniref:hypothetical protein n=1 Tax=unclassified Nocardioides TaxID=2615069 RepID=UPI0000EB613A|nr:MULTISPECIES: hypothetical protein [unclassified Nocardioides]ABL80743.1 hypothetical protein Noca_1229 [Nocardioides sp. JS614]
MPAIAVADLTMTYGELRAVDGVRLQVGEGEFFGILGRGPAPMGILAAFAVVVTLVAARLFCWETT